MAKRFIVAFLTFIGLIVPAAFALALLAAPARPQPLDPAGCQQNLANAWATTPLPRGAVLTQPYTASDWDAKVGADLNLGGTPSVYARADQELYGSLHVTTAVTDLGQPAVGKSVSAAFKFNW